MKKQKFLNPIHGRVKLKTGGMPKGAIQDWDTNEAHLASKDRLAVRKDTLLKLRKVKCRNDTYIKGYDDD